MPKTFIKPGVSAGDLYDTINTLSGLQEDGSQGEAQIGAGSIGPNKEIQVTPDGEVIINSSTGVVKGTFENAKKLDGQPASYYGKDSDTIHIYTHTYEGQIHNFLGTGKNGKVLIKFPLSEGDSFQINGTPVQAYTGSDVTDELYVGKWMSFSLDQDNNINFIGGGGTSKLIKKEGDTFQGQINFGSSNYNIKPTGEAALKKLTLIEDGELNFNNSSYKITNAGDAALKSLNLTGDLTANRVFNAVYNDYAEYIPRGENTEPGDIIAMDMTCPEERYIKATEESKPIGVHSNEWGHILGGDIFENVEERFIPVTLAGRVHVKIIGVAKKGNWVIPSHLPGIGLSVEGNRPNNAVGFLVEEDDRYDLRKLKVWVGGNFG